MNFVLSMTLICIAIAPADDEPPAGVDAPLTATPVVWITPPSIDFRRGLRLRGFKRAI